MIPVLPGLYDRPTPEQVEQARSEGMRRVSEKAERTQPSFHERATRFVLEHLKQHGPRSAEDLTVACKDAGITPHDDRAFGNVYRVLAARKQIQKVGDAPRKRGHGTAGGTIWAVVR